MESQTNTLLSPRMLELSTIDDLKALLITYPYCGLFRVLALQKAKRQGHPLEKEWLESAAIYCPDRSYLYKMYHGQSINKVPKEVAIIRSGMNPIPSKFIGQSAIERSPLPKSSFSSWQQNKPKPLDRIVNQSAEKPPTEETNNQEIEEGQFSFEEDFEVPKEPAIPKKDAAFLAEKSVQLDKDIVSETLAQVFAKQGKKDKAIDIYLKLSLRFPEKSSYFAGQIEKLK